MYPNFKDKYLGKSLFEPSDFLKKYRGKGLKAPETVIICYQRSVVNFAVSRLNAVLEKKFIVPFYRLGEKLGLCHSPIGAPAAAAEMEELIALGAKRFISFGTAGGLSEKLKHGGAVLCEKALRDEGTSHHYLKPAKFSYPDAAFTGELENILSSKKIPFVKGPSWTIDAPYRETPEELVEYGKEGILTVEMEAAAIFAVAEYRKVRAAGSFVISDILREKGWQPGFHFKDVKKNLEGLLELLSKNL